MRARIAIVCLVASANLAHADDKAKAKQLYDEGLRHYNLAEYTEAIRVWKDAYLIAKKPLLLFNIGQAYRLSDDCTQAMTFYESYEREQPNLKNTDELEQARGLCKDKLAAAAAAVKPPPPVQPPPPPPVQHHTEIHHSRTGLIVGIPGVVLAGAGIVFAVDAHAQSSDLDHFQGPWTQKQIDEEARGQRDVKLAWGFGITGVAAIGVGVALYALGGHAQESAVAITPTRGGAQIGWARAF